MPPVPAPAPDPEPWPQAVPRPPTARPGGPAPWAGLEAAARRGISLAAVEAALVRAGRAGEPPAPGPGPHASDVGLPWRPGATAAVLVALFEEGGEVRTVLTRRSAELRTHTGQVSFPGGRVDPGEHVVDAARREAAEEVGLDAAGVRALGWLQPVATYSSGSLIVPVVGALAGPPTLRPNPAEVARAFDVSLAELAADGAFHEERWTVPGRPLPASADGSFPVWFFDVAAETVWGATARVLYDLLCLVLGVEPPGP
jgi:8-oxo-dGTP pyrophosphatase MutT (NUDIX family)